MRITLDFSRVCHELIRDTIRKRIVISPPMTDYHSTVSRVGHDFNRVRDSKSSFRITHFQMKMELTGVDY